ELQPGRVALIVVRAVDACVPQPPAKGKAREAGKGAHGVAVEGHREAVLRLAEAGLGFVAQAEVQREIVAQPKVVLDVAGGGVRGGRRSRGSGRGGAVVGWRRRLIQVDPA